MYRAKILVADDDAEWRKLLSVWLRRAGYRLFFAAKAEEVPQLAEKRRPDCLLLDFQMGPQTAVDVCRSIKSEQGLRTLPVVILTSHPDAELRAYSECQADHFVQKDGKPERLLAVLEAVLRRRAWDRGALKKGDLELEPKDYSVYRAGRFVARLSREQFLLLQLLVQRSPEFVAPAEIYKHVIHEHRSPEDTDAIRSLAHRARKALDKTLARRIRSDKRLGWTYVELPPASRG